ncbi:MAG: DUF1638 domain-containing protein [Sphingomonadaceae bacterium]
MSGKCLILACGALAAEVVALRKQLGLGEGETELQCLPAEFHNTPSKIAPRVDEILTERRGEFEQVLVGYGECGTGGALDAVLAKHDAVRLPHAHCYEFYAGSARFAAITDAEIGSFFLTDYLVRNFDRLVIGGLGLDRFPHLRDSYFGNYRDLVYLAQTESPALQEQAKAAAEKLGLNYVYHRVGYGDLSPFLAKAGGKDVAAHV